MMWLKLGKQKFFDVKRFLIEAKETAAPKNTPEAEARLRSEHVNYFGPEQGPFRCDHCQFYKAVNETEGYCNHPEVKAYVEGAGCCNEYSSVEK